MSLSQCRRPNQATLAFLLLGLLGVPVTTAAAPTPLTTQEPAMEHSDDLVLSSCDVDGVAWPARCGVLNVPENPDQPDGRQISVSVVVIPATEEPVPDPIVPLMGGPGEDAISAAAIFADRFASLRHNRDIVLVDQRGTGRSGALRCELYSAEDPGVNLRDLFPTAVVERCAQRLGARADLTQYGYSHFATDLEHVRRALGYEALNLAAGSYGTRAAQVYLRVYPRSVRTVLFHSAVPIDVATPLPMAKTAQRALDEVFSACADRSACRAAFPNLDDEFREVLARLESGDVRVSVPDRTGTVALHPGRVAEWIRSMLYRPNTAAKLPRIIHRAWAGDWSPVVEGILSGARGADAGLSFGLFFSITCGEDMAFVREEDIERETRGTFLGAYRLRQQRAACEHWPKARLPADYRTPVRSSVPALFLSGDIDGATPLWFTDRVAPGFTERAEIVHRGRGHTEWDACIARLYEQFVTTGAARGLDPTSCEPTPRPPFETG